jgi:hypothetical protein
MDKGAKALDARSQTKSRTKSQSTVDRAQRPPFAQSFSQSLILLRYHPIATIESTINILCSNMIVTEAADNFLEQA